MSETHIQQENLIKIAIFIISFFVDPDKIGQLLSDSIFEAHQRTCLLSRDQIQVGWSQGISEFKVEQFKKMVSTSSS